MALTWREKLEQIGGFDNDMVMVPSGAVTKIITELEKAQKKLDNGHRLFEKSQALVIEQRTELAAAATKLKDTEKKLDNAHRALKDGQALNTRQQREIGDQIVALDATEEKLEETEKELQKAKELALAKYPQAKGTILAEPEQRNTGCWSVRGCLPRQTRCLSRS